MEPTVIGYFSEAEEFERYMECVMDDYESLFNIAKGVTLSNERSSIEIDKLFEKYQNDYDRMYQIIIRLNLKDELEDEVRQSIGQNYDYQSEYENFFYELAEQIKGFQPKGVIKSRIYMIVKKKPADNSYCYKFLDPDELAQEMEGEADSEMTVTKTGNNYTIEVDDMKLEFIYIASILHKNVKKNKEELVTENKMEMEYLGINPEISRNDLIEELVVNGVIDPFYEKNRRKRIYYVS